MQPTDTFIAAALEEFVTDTQNLYDATDPAEKEERSFWRSQYRAFVKAQTYFLQGVRLTATPSGYTVPSASRPGALIHRCHRAGGVWVCSCEAGDRGLFHWHTALIAATERGGELELLAEAAAEKRLHRAMRAARSELAPLPETRGLRRALDEAAAVLGCDPGDIDDGPIDPPWPIPGDPAPGRAAGLGRRLAVARALRWAA